MKKLIAAILMSLFLVTSVYGAESCVQSIQASGPYHVYQMVWVTDGSGDFTATATTQKINGIIMLVEFIPSATAAPTTLYDITLRNSQAIDVLGDTGAAAAEVFDGAGANLSATVASESQPVLNGNYGAVPVMGVLTLDVLSAGNSKGGTVRIHYLSIN